MRSALQGFRVGDMNTGGGAGSDTSPAHDLGGGGDDAGMIHAVSWLWSWLAVLFQLLSSLGAYLMIGSILGFFVFGSFGRMILRSFIDGSPHWHPRFVRCLLPRLARPEENDNKNAAPETLEFGYRISAAALYTAMGIVAAVGATVLWLPIILLFIAGYVQMRATGITEWPVRDAPADSPRREPWRHLIMVVVCLPFSLLAFVTAEENARQTEAGILWFFDMVFALRTFALLYRRFGPPILGEVSVAPINNDSAQSSSFAIE